VQVAAQPLRDQFILVNEDFTGQHLNSQCLDNLNIEANVYHPEPAFLVVDEHINVTESLHSHLLKTNCPVTGQPDWASVFIAYCGKRIVHENLLKYLISFREHQDFHEHCVERIFTDILARCKPSSLSVYARYTRRGGLDINPFRSTQKEAKPRVGRLLRQ
jgi:7-cyano-7-deazaguanine reductase